MTPEDMAKRKLLETVPFVRGDAADILPDDTFRSICEKWIPEINSIDTNGRLFIEHGYDSGYIADFLSNELIWATENSDKNIKISQQRKWNLLYTLECLSLCHVSNVLTWTVTENGVTPQTETTPWRHGPDRNWYDCDMEPINSYNLNEKLDIYKIPRYPRYTDEPSRYYNAQDSAWVGIAMSESLTNSSGLKERVSILGDTLPIRPFNDRGMGKWGGIPTFTTPFESDAPSLSNSPLISGIEYSSDSVKAALNTFVSKKKEIEEMYGFIISSLVDFVDNKITPVVMPNEPDENSNAETIKNYERNLLEYRKAEKCRNFASFYRFADMDLWKNFDYIMKTYRVQDESQYNLPTENTGQKGSFCKIDPSESQPKLGNQMIKLAKPLELNVVNLAPELKPTISRYFVHETKVVNVNDSNYDTKAAPIIWDTFNDQKQLVLQDLAVKTLADVKRQYDDMKAELTAAERCLVNNTPDMQSFERARIEEGIKLNSRIPTQRFMKPDVLTIIDPKDISIRFNKEAMGTAVGKMIRAGLERAGKMVKSDFSMKEQEDHLRGSALSLHAMVCMAVDAVEGRSVLEDWSADIYSSIAEHSMNDAILPRDRNSNAFKDIMKDPKKMRNHRFVNFSKVREGTKALRYGETPGKDGITTFGEWNQIEQMIPSPNFKPFVERADGLSMRELLQHGLTGTPLQNGLTRDNARYVMAPRITKWRLRSSLQEAVEQIKNNTINGNSSALLSHLDNPEQLNNARYGILEFVLNFCDSFAQNAHKTKMDIFNDPATKDTMTQTDDLEVRQQMIKAASETWQLSGSGLYVRPYGKMGTDESLFHSARVFVRGENREDIFEKEYNISSYRLPQSLLLASYVKEFGVIPKAIKLGLLPNEQYLNGNMSAFDYVLNGVKNKSGTNILFKLGDRDPFICQGNMISDNSQYIPLLKGLAFAKNPYSGTWQYRLNPENKDLNRMQLYMKYFTAYPGRGGCTRDWLSGFAILPMGINQIGSRSRDQLYEVAIDNMMRLAWNGDDAIRASRTFHYQSEFYIAGFQDSILKGHGRWLTNQFATDRNPYKKCPFVIEEGSMQWGASNSTHEGLTKELVAKRSYAEFFKVPLPSEEKLEYLTAYTITPFTRELYLEKNRILKYSPLNQDYMFITTYAPVRRNNLGILVKQYGADYSDQNFGLSSYGCGRGMDAIRKDEIDEKQRYCVNNQEYPGENVLLPSNTLIKEAVNTIRADVKLSQEFDNLKQSLVKECVIARTGNNREDRSLGSARMRCLMQDIGYTVKHIRECDPNLPKTVMSTIAMDPLARLGEPEITSYVKTDSEIEAELQSLIRKAYWGEDFYNIRRHLSVANHKFYQQHATGDIGKLSARYAYQYEFLQNIDFLKERYEAGKTIMQQPEKNNTNMAVEDWGWHYFKAIHQNSASINVKGIVRDYFANIDYKNRMGFDGTNLLRNMAFKSGNLLGDQNRQETLLHYPGSINYPKYEFGMEFYRDNITYGEFVGWTYNAFSKDSYNIQENIECFFKGIKGAHKGINKTSYTEHIMQCFEPDAKIRGIRSADQTIYKTESFDRPTDRILVANIDENNMTVLTPYEFNNRKKDIEDKLIADYRVSLGHKNVMYLNALFPMGGKISDFKVPFLNNALESDFTSNLLISDIKSKEKRRDYYPSMDEIFTLSTAFKAGLVSYCNNIGIEIKTDIQDINNIGIITENPPSWIDI